MTADQDLSARLPCGCCGAMQPLSAYANDPVVMVITLADHERAVQAAVAKAVEAEREACAAIIDANMLVGPDGVELLMPRTNPGNKLGLAYAAAIRSRGVAG